MVIFVFFLLFWIGLSFRYNYIVFALVSFIFTLLILRKYKRKFTLIGLAVLSIGIGISYINIDISREQFDGFVYESKDSYFLLISKGERLYVHYKDNPYEIGDYLSITGEKTKLDFITLESEFNFTEYLEKKGVRYEINLKKIETKFLNPIRIRENRKNFLSHFDDNTKEVVSSILFSDGNSGDTLTNMEHLHLSRLVNMTGVYIYAFLSLLEYCFSFLFKKKWARLISITLFIPYTIFTFPRFTVIRIFVLQILRWINKYILKGKFSNMAIVGTTGFSFLLINRYLAYQDSFIIGFTLPFLLKLVDIGTPSIHNFCKKTSLKILTLNLILIPFELKYYNGINPFLLPFQLVLTPLFILLAILSLLSFYRIPLYSIVQFLITPIDWIGGTLSKINISINAPPLTGFILLIYLILVVALYYYRAIGFKPISRGLTIFIATFLTLYILPINNMITESITFINVGQGDACLIRRKNSTVLIDTGGLKYKDLAESSLIPYFRKNRIYHIDLLITTHDDFDHSGAKDSLIENFYIKNVIDEANFFPINVGGITFNNFNTHIAEYSEENDKSLVIGFHLMHKDFLIMGDAPIKVEKNIINEFPYLTCDILKIGHHGSKTSTCDDFIKFLKPELAIISCGKNNKYGHPNQEVINILKNNNVPYLRTDIEGSISFSNYIFM